MSTFFSILILLGMVVLVYALTVSPKVPLKNDPTPQPTLEDDPSLVWREQAMSAISASGARCTCPTIHKSESQLYSENYRARLVSVQQGLPDPGDTAPTHIKKTDPQCEVHMWKFQ